MIRPGFTVWLTGPPNSGKTTLGLLLARSLRALGVATLHVQEQDLRNHLGAGDDPDALARQAIWLASLAVQGGAACVVGVTAPTAEQRREARASLGEYLEVHLDCPLEQLVNRDASGLYAQALASGGEPPGGPYQAPLDPEVRCPTGREAPQESLARVLAYLAEAGLIAASSEAGDEAVYSDDEEAEIVARLKDLGYL